MPILTSAPLVGGAGRKVSGRVVVTATDDYASGTAFVTRVPQSGIFRDGQFFNVAGEPLELMPTPEGIGMRIDLYLSEENAPRATAHVTRVVVVPEGPSVDWTALEDFVLPDPTDPPVDPTPSAGFGWTPFGTGPFGM